MAFADWFLYLNKTPSSVMGSLRWAQLTDEAATLRSHSAALWPQKEPNKKF